MEVEVRVEVFLMKFIELWCPVARDMVIAEVLADDRAILGFGQGVIVGMSLFVALSSSSMSLTALARYSVGRKACTPGLH